MFIDTADAKEIRRFKELGFLEGVTTNPTILLKENLSREEQIENITEINSEITFVQLVGDSYHELWADYRTVLNIYDGLNLGIKVPINFVGLKFIRSLKEQEPDRIVLGTAIYSAEQGILGALAGCDYLAPYINRMLNNNIDPFEVIANLKKFIDAKNLKTQIMGASFKNTHQVVKAYTSGADTVTVPSELMDEMMNKSLAEEAIEVFNLHGRELEDEKE